MVVETLSLVPKGQTKGFSGCSHTGDTVHSGHSSQWNSGIWWLGHCSLVPKGQTSGFSGCSHTVDTVDAVDAVHSGCSTIVVYGGGDIVFDTKRSIQRTQ